MAKPTHNTFRNERRSTNVEFVTDLMSFGSPLRQVFILEAIASYAKHVAKSPALPDTDLLCGAAWKQIGEEINAELIERYKH